MNIQTQKFFLTTSIGQLECALDLPPESSSIKGIALVAHPHPLYGGTMHNKVVQTLVRTLTSLGYITARMNFRGVGASMGVHDHGIGETEDMLVLLEYMQQYYPNLPFVLAGFSFGTFVQARMYQKLKQTDQFNIQRLILVGTAALKWDIPEVPNDTILIHGELDDTIPLQHVLDWARPLDLPITVIPGADHFFHRKLHHIKQIIVDRWEKNNFPV
jgi:alpha/beta superfamily hydrolase